MDSAGLSMMTQKMIFMMKKALKSLKNLSSKHGGKIFWLSLSKIRSHEMLFDN